MNASPTRSVVESMNAPKVLALPPARASAPSRMSSTEPRTNTTAPAQKKSHSFRYSKYTSTEAAMHSETPDAVSIVGVTRVRARLEIEREASRRAPPV